MHHAHAILDQSLPPHAAGRRPPLRHKVTFGLVALITVVLFSLSGAVLWTLGYNYDGLQGSAATKIHPVTYLTLLAFAFLLLVRRHPVAYSLKAVGDNPGALVFMLATLALGAFIILDGRRGISTVFDTYLMSIFLALLLHELDDRQTLAIEKLLHVLFTANALLALVETAISHRFFPYRFDGEAFEWDLRATALLGHPLDNATATAIYTISLIAGGGRALGPLSRIVVILTQLTALVAFGGRSALTVTLLVVALWGLVNALRVLRGGRMSMLSILIGAMLLPSVAIAVGGLAASGFFDVAYERFFTDDRGSAQARLGMIELFGQIPLRVLLLGADPDFIDSLRRSEGLEWGIENPVVRLLLYQGVAFTTFIVAGFALFLRDLARHTRPGILMPLLSFLIIVNTFESIANKTQILARFVMILLVLFPRESLRPPWSRRPLGRS